MKMKYAMKRKLIQLAAFGYSNTHLVNFKDGRIYTGKWKQFCNPGLNCYSCPAASLACPIGALQAVSGSMNFDFSFYVVGILLAFGVISGRAVCGWLCPFGLVQELIYRFPSRKLKLKRGFLFIKYAVLVIFVILLPIAATNYMGMGKPAFCEFICPAGTLEGGIPLLSTHEELRQTAGALFFLKFAILVITMAACVFVYRFFCRVLCPLGAIYGLLNKVSLYHLEVDELKCISCGKCRIICKMEIDPVKTPDSMECIRCKECVNACPKGAIYAGFKAREQNPPEEKGKSMENTGIKPAVIQEICSLAQKYSVKRVLLFGSRARGDYKRVSDIDLAVSGGDFVRFALDVEEETSTLLKYDIVNMDDHVQEELRHSIEKEGKVLYEEI